MGFLTDIADKVFGAQPKGADDDKGAPALDHVADQPPEDLELASFVKRKVEDVRMTASRIAHEGVWMTNIAYALGYDSVYYDTSTRQYKPVGGPLRMPSRNRVHANKILPAMQNRLARMCKNPPRWETRPEGDSTEAKDKAALDYDVLLDLWEKLDLDEKRIDLGMWLQQCGHAFMVGSYDSEKGDPLVDPVTGEFEGFNGEIEAEVASAFEFFFDPKAKTDRDAKWAVRAKVRDLSYFRDRYPRGVLVREEYAWLLSTQYELRINSLNSTGPNTSGVQEQMRNAAIELSYYEKPTRRFPKGRHIIVANGLVLENKDLYIGEFPFVKFDDIKVAGKFYSEAAVTHARPLADQYNRNLVRTSAWVNRMLAGKYLAAKGHGLAQEALNDQSGEVVEYNPVPNAAPPSAMQTPVIPEYAYKERKDIESDLYEQFGLSEVSRGQLPSAGIPAVGMQLLVEQDETRVGIEITSHENSWARFLTILLKFANRSYQTDRQIKKKSNNGFRFITFNGDDLSSEPDVRVIRGSTIPANRSLRRQEILNAYSQGLMGDPNDPLIKQNVLGELEFGDLPDVWKDHRLDMAQIHEVICMLKEGQMPEFNKLDNHPLHIQELNRFRKSDSYKVLSPSEKENVEFLISEHAKAAVQFQNPQLQQQIQNTQQGLMPDGSHPGAMMEAQVRGSNIQKLNKTAAMSHAKLGNVIQKTQAKSAPVAGIPPGPGPNIRRPMPVPPPRPQQPRR